MVPNQQSITPSHSVVLALTFGATQPISYWKCLTYILHTVAAGSMHSDITLSGLLAVYEIF